MIENISHIATLWIGLILGAFATTFIPRTPSLLGGSIFEFLYGLSTPSRCLCGRKISGLKSWPLLGWIIHRGKCICGLRLGIEDLKLEIGGSLFLWSWIYHTNIGMLPCGMMAWITICYYIMHQRQPTPSLKYHLKNTALMTLLLAFPYKPEHTILGLILLRDEGDDIVSILCVLNPIIAIAYTILLKDSRERL